MNFLHFQSVGGASGDMVLGALGSLGLDLQAVEELVNKLPIEPVGFRVEAMSSHGCHGIRVVVETSESETIPHRTLHDIETMISATSLPGRAVESSLRVFRRLAEAEGIVHQKPVEDVHFHEVGALDSIADIVGSCVGLELLEVEGVQVAPLPVGQGTVECAHGIYPVPAPATSVLLDGFPVVVTDEPHELITPTGAALLTTWHQEQAIPSGSRLSGQGIGFGQRTLVSRPNMLRVLRHCSEFSAEQDIVTVLECQVDDSQPEFLGVAMERLLAQGALDVYTTPVYMKKNRPGCLLTVLCRPGARDGLLNVLFRETTTFGIRESSSPRQILNRRMEVVNTAYGEIRIKVGSRGEEMLTSSPEVEDCVRCAEASGVAVRVVYEEAKRKAAVLFNTSRDE